MSPAFWKKRCYFHMDTIENSFGFWSHGTIPSPTFLGWGWRWGGRTVCDGLLPLGLWTERRLSCTWGTCSKDLFWFGLFLSRTASGGFYSFCYCWLLGNFLLKETCVSLGVWTRVCYKIIWARCMFVFCFFLKGLDPPRSPPPPGWLQGRGKKSLLSVFKRWAGGNSKGLPCQYHRYCVYLEQPVLQLPRSARSTGFWASELTWEEEEEEKGGGIFLSFLFSLSF